MLKTARSRPQPPARRSPGRVDKDDKPQWVGRDPGTGKFVRQNTRTASSAQPRDGTQTEGAPQSIDGLGESAPRDLETRENPRGLNPIKYVHSPSNNSEAQVDGGRAPVPKISPTDSHYPSVHSSTWHRCRCMARTRRRTSLIYAPSTAVTIVVLGISFLACEGSPAEPTPPPSPPPMVISSVPATSLDSPTAAPMATGDSYLTFLTRLPSDPATPLPSTERSLTQTAISNLTRCPDDAGASTAIGTSVNRIQGESCGFSISNGHSRTVTCPPGWSCLFVTTDRGTIVMNGQGQSYVSTGGRVRYSFAYAVNDPEGNACGLLLDAQWSYTDAHLDNTLC
jgi:hypothetical protein